MATTSKITLTNGKGGVKTVAEPAYLRMQQMLEKQGWFPTNGQPIKPKPIAGKAGQTTALKQPPFTPKEVIDMRAKKESEKEVEKEPAPMADMKEIAFDVSTAGKPAEVVTKLNPDGTPAQTQNASPSKKK
jgi:cell division protein FtsN